MSLYITSQPIYDQFYVGTTGLTGGSFTVDLELNNSATAVTATVTEDGGGWYYVTFTPTSAGFWALTIDYNDYHFVETYPVRAQFAGASELAVVDSAISSLNNLGSSDITTACLSALADLKLDKLIVSTSVLSDDLNASSMLGQLMTDGDVGNFSQDTDSLVSIASSIATLPSAESVADSVWDEAAIDHVIAGSFGASNQNLALTFSQTTTATSSALSSYDPPTRAELTSDITSVLLAISSLNNISVDEIFDEAIAGHLTAGTFGDYINRIKKYTANKITILGTSYSVKEDDGTTEFEGGTTTTTERTPA